MRTLLAIAAMLIGAVLWTAPAAAHGSHGAAAGQPVKLADAEKELGTGPRICLFSQNGKRAEPTPNDVAKVEAAHETDPSHNPADHSHPVGEDTHHQKAAHGALDVAHMPAEAHTPPDALARPEAPQATDRVCGIEVSPPVPPPLG
jgi:hypothetical protein